MTKEERQEKAELHKELVDLLTNTQNDYTYYRRVVWANQIIANILSNFEILESELQGRTEEK